MWFRSISVDWIAVRWSSFTGGNSDARAVNTAGHRMRPVTIIRMAITSPSSHETQWWRTVGVGNLAERREIDSGVLTGRCWIYNSVRHPLQRATCRHATATPSIQIAPDKTLENVSRWIENGRFYCINSIEGGSMLHRDGPMNFHIENESDTRGDWGRIVRLKVIEVLSGNIHLRNNRVNNITLRQI